MKALSSLVPKTFRSALPQLLTPDLIRYSVVWEDMQLLNQGLQVTPDDDVLSITSAGDNVLGLLLQKPRSITAIDFNTAQSALLELKVTAIRTLPHAQFLELLGITESAKRLQHYQLLRPLLSKQASRFWNARKQLLQEGVITQGRLEKFFRSWQRDHLAMLPEAALLPALLQAPTLERQRELFAQLNTPAFRESFTWYFGEENMAANGRDPEQFRYVMMKAGEYFYDRFCYACTELPLRGNYYLEYFLTPGYQDLAQLHPYLLEENYQTLREQLPKLRLITSDLERFLMQQPAGSFSKANFSNIFEYVPEAHYHQLLTLICHTFRPGSLIAYWNLLVPRQRPESMRHLLHPHTEKAQALWQSDRSWFYRNFVLEEVQ